MSALVCQWPRVRIPNSCRDVEIVIGVDEAGRGPVLGSLVYGVAFWPASKSAEIAQLGFNDSKQLTEATRDSLFKKMCAHPDIGWVVEELTAEKLSNEMLRVSPISLNALSYDAVIHALETIRDAPQPRDADAASESAADGARDAVEIASSTCSAAAAALPPIINEVFVDTVGDPDYYKSRLTRALGADFARFTIEKKADATYPVVSAASIVAKVTRDTLMKQWKCGVALPPGERSITNQFGSGYPGDPACVQWLQNSMDREKVFLYPTDLCRFSWGTVKEIAKAEDAPEVKWVCDEEENDGASEGRQSITSFFGGAGEKRPKRAAYFLRRKMRHVLPSEL